jgi:hypothetical protein
MLDSIKGLLADITDRFPQSKIVLVGDKYYLCSQDERVHVRNEDIEMLISDGYLIKNRVGGVFPSNKAIDNAEHFYEKKIITDERGRPATVGTFPYHYI